MATVVKFPGIRKGTSRAPESANGVVLLFTGVRYERLADAAAPTKQPPVRVTRRTRVLRSN